MAGRDSSGHRDVVLLSGGLDSGVALGLTARRQVGSVLALFFDYGQPAVRAERRAARALAGRFGVEFREVALPWLGDCSSRAGSQLAPGGEAPALEPTGETVGDDCSAAAVWVPARNLVLLSAGAAHAEAEGADAVVVGFNREEAATFPDNGRDFLDAVDRVLAFACRAAIRVEAPLADRDKVEIVQAAVGLGLGPGDFWSCYRDRDPAAVCRCESCCRSERAWAAIRGSS